MAAITLNFDATYTRVGVNLSAWTADGPVTVSRVHSDGSRNAVRGMSAVSGGSAFGWDYEFPFNYDVTYEAWDGSTLITSAPLTVTAPTRATLTAPGLPSFGGPVLIAKRPEPSRSRPKAVIDVQGRSRPIVKADILKSASFTLALMTRGDAEAYALLSMMEEAPVLLLRIPGTRETDWCYVSVGDVGEVPVSRVLPPAISVGDVEQTWAAWEIACQVVDSPVGGVFGDPTATYQASLDRYATYNDRLAGAATYLDALRAS
ncbi:MAG: hypothetical protein HOY69_41495 [Streptomyces sp.]|nr:hypothetical protein [Streptomyces sp.]